MCIRDSGKTTDSKTDLGEIVREIEELAVFNDEAHHIHDSRLAWFKSIQDIHHRMLQKDCRLALQVDVTATPRHNSGAIFVQTVSDYPLVEAIHQNVVKHPVLPDAASRAKLAEHKSPIITEKYADYLQLGVEEWRKSCLLYTSGGVHDKVAVPCAARVALRHLGATREDMIKQYPGMKDVPPENFEKELRQQVTGESGYLDPDMIEPSDLRLQAVKTLIDNTIPPRKIPFAMRMERGSRIFKPPKK